MKPATITAAILTHNEATMIASCLDSLRWCDELLVLDHQSTDETVQRAQRAGARVISSTHDSFARRREELLAACATDWIFYIDADERATPALAKQIKLAINADEVASLSFPRLNFFFGQQFHHGGWQTEVVTRVFKKQQLRGWQGDIHESPVFAGRTKQLSTPLWHFSHRSVADGLIKTASWTPIEATLLYGELKQQISILTILRKGLGELWRRGFAQAGWKDGQAGLIEVLTQAINRTLVYMQVWEKQQQPSASDRYQQLEQELTDLWRNQA